MSKKLKTPFDSSGSKRRAPRWQRDRNISLAISIIIPVVVIIVAGLVGYWAYDNYVAAWREPAVRVNDTVFDMDYYVKRLRTVSPDTSPYEVIQNIQEEELFRQGAEQLGISVLPGNVTDAVEDFLISSYGSQGNPDPTEEELADMYSFFLDYTGLTDAEARAIFESDLLNRELRWYFRENKVPDEAKHVHLQRVAKPTEEEAQDFLDQVNAGNETAIAQLESGDIGWVPEGVFEQLDPVAFDLQPGQLGGPVSTDRGYEVLKVVEIDEAMEITDAHRNVLGNRKFDDWLEDFRLSSTVEDYLDSSKIQWARDKTK